MFLNNQKWTALVCTIVCAHILLSLLASRGFALSAIGDLAQCILLLAATIGVLLNTRTLDRKAKLFWALMGVGCSLWFCAQAIWTYFEVFLRQDVPNPFVGDVVFFLHIVPMMAAVAVQPHIRQDGRIIRAHSLDFILLLIWWLYLYLFVVIPWQYVYPVESVYGSSFDRLYGCEQFVLVVSLFLAWRRSSGAWRKIYARLFGAALIYCIASITASEAIDSHTYFTGSLYDVPLIAAMACFVAVGFTARQTLCDESGDTSVGPGHGIGKARLAMAAVFVTPLMVAWSQFSGNVPSQVRTYRLLVTIGVMILMGALVFLKQHLLDQELLGLLQSSHENLEEMRQLKDELENKEQSLRWHSIELQRKNLELQEISFTDSLTRIWNRRYLEEILAAEGGQVLRNYQRAQAADIRKTNHSDLVFIMVDMDFFKEVNDQYGHPAGDRLLQLVAERLTTVVRKSDVLVRWGGEEFLIMNRSTDPAGTPAFCSRILEVIAGEIFDLGNGIRVRKTCSVGWAPFPWSRGAFEAICAEEVIALADSALYRAKAMGRNQGVGILPSDAAAAANTGITLAALQDCGSKLTRMIRTANPEHSHLPLMKTPEVELTHKSTN